MTEVADGKSVTMSATQDISLQDRQECHVSSRLSPCLNTSLVGTVEDPVDLDTEGQVRSLDKGPPVSNSLPGEAVGNPDEVIPATESLTVSVEADDPKAILGSSLRELQDMKESFTEKPVSYAAKADSVELSGPVERFFVKTPGLEVPAVESMAVETCTLGELAISAPVSISSVVETHAVESSFAELRDMDLPVTAVLQDASSHGGERSPTEVGVEDGVEGVVLNAKKLVGKAEGVTPKDKAADIDFRSGKVSLSWSFKNDKLSAVSTDNLSPPTGNEDAGQRVTDEVVVIRSGESRMDEAMSVTNLNVPFLKFFETRYATGFVGDIPDHTTTQQIVEKLTEVTGHVPAHERADRLARVSSDGMANKLADAIADEIADQIADRMADELADKMADEMAVEMAEEMADGIADDMADRMADGIADDMADRMAEEMAARMTDEMADRMADEMVAKMADELADEMADEVIEGDHGRAEGVFEHERRDDETRGVRYMVGKMAEKANIGMDDDEHDGDEGTPGEQLSFVEELVRFFKQRNLEYKAPKFYGVELNVLKLWRVVSRYGGYDHVTVSKLWRTVGEEFKPPKTCTTISWSFRGFYEKALLDYERLKSGVSAPYFSQRAVQITNDHLIFEQPTASPATPSSEPTTGATPGSGSGRARRDAAARAMQGWHSQRMGNGDTKELIAKDKGSGGKLVRKEKKLTNIGGNGLKRKGSNSYLERAVKAVQAKGRPRLHEESVPSNSAVAGRRNSKQQVSGRRPLKLAKLIGQVGGFNPPIADEGPKADWVKINVHKHLDCFEVYALVPGLAREEVRIQCEPGGRLVIAGMPEDPENPWGVTPFRKVISLPSRIDAHQTSAVVTLYGQLYVRVPIADDKST